MIIYLDEDGPYVSWVSHHRDGFVIDWLRMPTRRHPIVHRATCKKIRVAKSKKTHWTTGRRLKACSLDLEQLMAWSEQESGQALIFCEDCAPQKEPSPDGGVDHHHLTKLEKEILDYVLEIAVVHLDNPKLVYELTVQEVADCLSKTTGQINAALLRLVRSRYLRLDNEIGQKTELRGEHRVFPTSIALRMEPAFKKFSEQELEAELVVLAGN